MSSQLLTRVGPNTIDDCLLSHSANLDGAKEALIAAPPLPGADRGVRPLDRCRDLSLPGQGLAG